MCKPRLHYFFDTRFLLTLSPEYYFGVSSVDVLNCLFLDFINRQNKKNDKEIGHFFDEKLGGTCGKINFQSFMTFLLLMSKNSPTNTFVVFY